MELAHTCVGTDHPVDQGVVWVPALISVRTGERSNLLTLRNDHPSFSGGHNLGGKERVRSGAAPSPRSVASVRAAVRMGGVLHERDVPAAAQLCQLFGRIAHEAADMHQDEGSDIARVVVQRHGDLSWRGRQRSGVHVDKDGLRAGTHDGERSGCERIRRHEHLAASDARSIASSASVPLDTATAYGRRLLAAKQRSNSSTSGPPERLPELRERRQKRRISLTSSSNSWTERNRAGSNTVAGNWLPLVSPTSTETLAGPLDIPYGSALAMAAPATGPVADDWIVVRQPDTNEDIGVE